VWTPKRILILIATLTLFLTGFGVYAHFLGNIDGLPPLPPGYEWAGPSDLPQLPPPDPSDVDKKLAMSYGTDCEEIRRRIKLDLRSKGWCLAANDFETTPDGRVELKPFSACIFPKQRGDGKFPEINTVQCEVAYLTLDRRVTNHLELANRKVIGIELRGHAQQGIVLRNNRQTPDLNDDVEVRITDGPLFYEEPRNLIWTKGSVSLIDLQPQPETRIKGSGMELHLVKEGPGGPKSDKKRPKGDAISGVERLILLSFVDMWLTVDGGPGFLGNNQVTTPKNVEDTGVAKKAEKAQVHIHTDGPFTYEVQKDRAIFESPLAKSKGAEPEPLAPSHVTVERQHRLGGGNPSDQLVCDYLELQFRRKTGDAARSVRDDRAGGREIESAYAKALPGNEVTLVMDTENLDAHGLEMTFYGPTEKSGPRTLLKGNPLRASKDDHCLEALELLLIGADKNNQGQQAVVTGPGRIDLCDKTNPDQPTYPFHASWKDKLTTSKVKEGDRIFDLLILTKDACFIDDEHKQALHADRLEVMLEPTAPKEAGPPGAALGAAGPSKQAAPGAPRQRPYKIDAFGNVRALSPDFNVRRARRW
jgi:hypothetical protein